MGFLDGKISQDDKNEVNNLRNHSDTEFGFEESSTGADDFSDLNSLFDSFESGGGQSSGSDGFGSFGSDTNNNSGGFGNVNSGFGNNSGGFGNSSGGFGNTNSGGFGTFGGNSGGFGTNNNGFGTFGNQGFNSQNIGNPFGQQPQQQVEQQPDLMDKAMTLSAQTAENLGVVLLDMVKSIKLRTLDDFGYLGRNSIITGCIIFVISIALAILGGIANIGFLSFFNFPFNFLISGLLLLSSGMILIGISAFLLTRKSAELVGSETELDDLSGLQDNNLDDIESDLDAALDDLFGDDFDLESDTPENNDTNEDDSNFFDEPEEPEDIDYDDQLDNVLANDIISRDRLFETFKHMFPTNTTKFSDIRTIDESSDDFASLDTICTKALANIANCELSEVGSRLESARETIFSYELKVKRMNKVKKLDDIAHEVEVYMRDNSEDDRVNASVTIEGDFYKIIVTKGTNAVVTFGDIFKKDYCVDFFLNKKNRLPMITGIDELGKVILDDAKVFDTMLVAGKPRSGKSWYVLSILMSLMLFNSPEDVQFVIVDPKESNLFKTIALMPHVCGLHNNKRILDILSDIIDVEAPRRKKLLADNRCDDIWALRDKGIKLPVLYLVIDEYITVINDLDKDDQKEFDAKIQTLISQLPSQGIRLLFVPHRATGVVNKTNRTMLQFTAAVKADAADVIDTLGIKTWTRALTQPGDIAIKTSNMKSAQYVRGAALTTQDSENMRFIETAAKCFYKIGVEIPDLSNMHIAYNRDDNYIKNELNPSGKMVQYTSLENNSDEKDAKPAFNIVSNYDDSDGDDDDSNSVNNDDLGYTALEDELLDNMDDIL